MPLKDRIGDFCFRFRGGIVAILAVYSLIWAQPEWTWLGHGFVFALLGESLRLWAIGYSGEPTRGEFLEAPRLVTAGPYAYVRNPLYVGNLLNSLGVVTAAFMPWASTTAWGLWGSVVLFYLFLGNYEEKFLLQTFGTEYEDYRRHVPAWIPKAYGYARAQGEFSWRQGWRFERTSLIWWVLIWLALAAKGWYLNSLYGA